MVNTQVLKHPQNRGQVGGGKGQYFKVYVFVLLFFAYDLFVENKCLLNNNISMFMENVGLPSMFTHWL